MMLRQAPFDRAEQVFLALHAEGRFVLPALERIRYGVGRCGGPPLIAGFDEMPNVTGFFIAAAQRLDAPHAAAVGRLMGRLVRLAHPDGPQLDRVRVSEEWDGALVTAAAALSPYWPSDPDEQDRRVFWVSAADLAGKHFSGGDARTAWVAVRTMYAVLAHGHADAFARYWSNL